MRWHLLFVTVLVLVLAAGCGSGGPGGPTANGGENGNGEGGDNGGIIPAGLLRPSDLTYLGAFRLPEPSGSSSWEYSGAAMTCYPGGDPEGPDDGFPGSIYGAGHDWDMHISEISIPVPVISPTNNPADLNRAQTLQPFTDVRGGVGNLDVLGEIIRVGIAYLPPQDSQGSAKLHLCWGQHFQEDAERVASHMWCNLDLSGSRGAWWVDGYSPYSVNDYMFEIPRAWADAYTPGMRLATGRFRDGGWSGQGPCLFAIGPWNHGNPPPNNTVMDAVPLLLYSSTATDAPPYHTLQDYHHADEWSGGAWLSTDTASAVVFVGTKGEGDCWYGLPDGTVWPDEPPYPDDPTGQRGWWSSRFAGQMLFYDPSELAAAARGPRQPYEPQPYTTMDLDGVLYHIGGAQQKHHVRACAFDREHALLYLFEPLADGERSLVHVWAVGR
ncbi:MAG: hypothetical protein R6V19_03750 [Armatimonadota bacterium]